MKRKLLGFLLLFILCVPTFTYAHPGRTDANGGHTCRTNCAKWGLQNGEYHYHNGGSSSGGGGSSPSTTISEPIIETPAPTIDYAAIERQKQEQKDSGIKQGYDKGYQDGYKKAEAKNTIDSGEDAFKEGYTKGYNDGFSKGTSDFEKIYTKAYADGKTLGEKTNTINVPQEFLNEERLKKNFESAFETAVSYRIEALGFEDGKKDKEKQINFPSQFTSFYESGFERGQEQLKDSYIEEGEKDSLLYLQYKQPNYTNEKYTNWHKEGFENSEKRKELEKEAFENGRNGLSSEIPDKYTEAKKVYTHYYEKGLEQYKKEQHEKEATEKENNLFAFFGFIAIVGIWIGRRYYVARKMIK